MFSRIEAKQSAKLHLKGSWKLAALGFFLYSLISLVILIPLAIASEVNTDLNILYLIVSFLISSFSYGGIACFSYNIAKGNKACLKDFLWAFKYPLKNISLVFFISLFIFLWSLLFIIPGLIKSYSYYMAIYILIDNPELSPLEAISQSRILMHGSKMDLFITDLSFIGWSILAAFTLGIGYFWLYPYMEVTYATIYMQIKGNSNKVTPIANHLNESDTIFEKSEEIVFENNDDSVED